MEDKGTSGQRIVALGDEHLRWMNPFHAALLKGRLNPQYSLLGDQSLRCVLSAGEASGAEGRAGEMEVLVEPFRDGKLCYRSSPKLALSYRISAGPERPWMPLLERFWKIAQAFEPHLPPGLGGFAFVGSPPEGAVRGLTTMFPFLTVEESVRGDERVAEVLIRTTSRCNQNCPFCSGPMHDTPGHDMVLAAIGEAASRLPGAMISLTGGEPTLRPRFLEEVRAALDNPQVGSVQVQSNAVAFSRRLDATAFPSHGKLSFFLSLHAMEEHLYDECTGTKGQFSDAIRGIERILEAGHRTTLNTVVNRANLGHLMDMAQRLPEWSHQIASGNPPVWHFSALICTDRSPLAADYLVTYGELIERTLEATKLAQGHGMEVQSMLTSTFASVPPCVVPPELRPPVWTVLKEANSETGYEDMTRRFVKAHRCGKCHADKGCMGVPQPYALRFGLDELQPF